MIYLFHACKQHSIQKQMKNRRKKHPSFGLFFIQITTRKRCKNSFVQDKVKKVFTVYANKIDSIQNTVIKLIQIVMPLFPINGIHISHSSLNHVRCILFSFIKTWMAHRGDKFISTYILKSIISATLARFNSNNRNKKWKWNAADVKHVANKADNTCYTIEHAQYRANWIWIDFKYKVNIQISCNSIYKWWLLFGV